VTGLLQSGRVALGTDSRLSGARDLLDELRIAAGIGGFDDAAVEAMVTRDSARLLRLADRGTLQAGTRADLLILPAQTGLGAARRADVRLVLIDGVVRYGDEDCAQCAAPASQWTAIRVDGRPKILDNRIAALLSKTGPAETGLEFPNLTWRAA
jgi:cytosine/adenosine deaminase-related metal-dependent hydrolase